MSDHTTITSKAIGDIFADTIDQVSQGIAGKNIGAVDLAVAFNSVLLDKKTKKFIFGKTKSTQTTTEIRLATRIYTDSSTVPPGNNKGN